MDMALAQLHDRLSTLEQENILLRLRLQSYEQGSLQFSVSNASEHRLLEATAQVANALLTRCFADTARVAPFNQAVNTALQILGESLETDRVAVIENFDMPSARLPYWKMLYE